MLHDPSLQGTFLLTLLLAQHQPPWGKGRETLSPEKVQSYVFIRQKDNRECPQINPEVRAHIARAVSKVRDCGTRRKLR